MISVVKDQIVKAIKAADREAVNQGYRHIFKVSRNTITSNMVEVTKRVFIDKGITGVPDKDVSRICANRVNQIFTSKNHQAEYAKLGGGKEARRLSYRGGSTGLEIHFPMGGYGHKHTLKSGKTSQFTTNQAVFSAMQETCLNKIRKDLKKLGHTIARKEMRGGLGKSAARPTDSFIRLSALHGTKSNRTTVAAFGGAEQLKANDETAFDAIDESDFENAIKSGTDINELYQKVYESYQKAFYVEVGLEQALDMSVEEMRKNLTVEINYDPANKNATMKDYDSRELQKFIKNHTAKIASEVQSKLTNKELKTSRSPKEHLTGAAAKAFVRQMFVHETHPDMRYKVNKKLLAFADVKGKSKIKFYGNKGKKSVTKQAAGKVKRAPKGIGRVAAKAGENPLALRNMLNELLPVAVASNMTSPALNYRTGRFANSVRVANVTQGPRGGNKMIEASYMNNPYETFAPGGKQYTPQRNPEKLIKKSIREIAAGIIGPRFGITIQ